MNRRRSLVLFFLAGVFTASHAAPRNIVFILTDDHRFDAMGFLGHPFLETPSIDSLAKNGAYLPNASLRPPFAHRAALRC
jgi:arylsulfatase A-like enzyme